MLHNTKRMVLVDEKLLDSNPILQHFQSKQDLSWKQPTEDTVKTSISKGLKATLDDPTVPDDVKAKRYSHDLNRFLHTKRKLPEVPTVEDLLDEPPKKPKTRKALERRTSLRSKKNRSVTRISSGSGGDKWSRCITNPASLVRMAASDHLCDMVGCR